MGRKYGICGKCQTKWVVVEEYNDMWLCHDNLCYEEEVEKDSGKHILDKERLEEYRKMVAGTKGIVPTAYNAT